jgi:molybdate transport system substrate-binding protein
MQCISSQSAPCPNTNKRHFGVRSAVVMGVLALVVMTFLANLACRRDDAAQALREGSTPPILVFAAASTTNALDDIRGAFAKQTGVEVQVSYASSAILAQQIMHGAEADVFLSADEQWADELAKKCLVAKRQYLLGNRLVVVIPIDSTLRLTKLSDLVTGKIEHLAIGDPRGVPAGQYAKQAITKLGLWEPLKAKVVSAEDVRRALIYVETGAAEAAIVYSTDAAISKMVKVAVEVPLDLTEPIRYPVVLLKHGESQEAANEFYRYLRSPAAAEVFAKYGFVVL